MLKIGVATTMDDRAPSYHLRFRSVLDLLKQQGKVSWYPVISKTLLRRRIRFAFQDPTDLILVTRIRDLAFLKRIFDFADSRGIPVVYETDDLILHERRSDAPIEHADELAAYLRRAAGIIVSTPYLAEEMKACNDHVSVFPNLLDPGIWNVSQKVAMREAGPLQVCCIGTGLMTENLSLVVPAMEQCGKRYGKDVIFSLRGNGKYIDATVKKMHNVKIIDRKMSYTQFAQTLQRSSYAFGIVPLSDLRFNRSKSAIKYLEFAVSGIPSVFSNVEPYRMLPKDRCCLLTDNDPASWTAAVTDMVEDRGLRERLSSAALADVRDNHMLNRAWAGRYLALLEECCGT